MNQSFSETTLVTIGLVFYAVVFVVYIIPSIIIYWKLFTKAGQPGWKYIIPFYSQYIMGVIAKRKDLGLVAAIAIAASYGNYIDIVYFKFASAAASLVYIVTGLMVLNSFIKQYDAGIGKWILFIFFPYIGVFLVGSTNYKGSSVVPVAAAAQTPGATTPPASIYPTPQAQTTPTAAPVVDAPQVVAAPEAPVAPANDQNIQTPPPTGTVS